MQRFNSKTSRMVTLLTVLMLLALIAACYPQATPSSSSSLTPLEGEVLDQDGSSTPSLSTAPIPPDAQISPDNVRPPKPNECPKLDSALAQIVQAPDPLDQAQQLQLTVKDNKIQVLLILSREDASFLQDFQVEIGTQSGTKVQAFVPINQLCNLANSDAVLAIRLPDKAVLP